MTSYIVPFPSYRRLLFVFDLSPPLGRLEATYTVQWKARSGLSIRVNCTFSLCYGWGASKNRQKIGHFVRTQSVWPKISGRRGRPPITFAQI